MYNTQNRDILYFFCFMSLDIALIKCIFSGVRLALMRHQNTKIGVILHAGRHCICTYTRKTNVYSHTYMRYVYVWRWRLMEKYWRKWLKEQWIKVLTSKGLISSFELKEISFLQMQLFVIAFSTHTHKYFVLNIIKF